MIPQRLSVRNFLCYRENVPPLDFTGLHLACLCGPNGHGKSSLLDAITWCLWGKARGRTQDELISYGADETRVELEFLARDTQYRVIRSHARGLPSRRRPGVSDLQLQVLDTTDSQPITGNSIRETQAKIEQLIGMDYDTFINSAFLLQGRADEFTSKTPAERKSVLAAILGLGTYDRLQVLARERLAEAKAATDRTEGIVQQMRREAETMGDPSVELTGVGRRLTDLDQQLSAQRQEVNQLKGQVAELERKRQALANDQRQIRDLAQEIKQLESRITTTQQRIEGYQALLEQTTAIEEGLGRLRQARQRFEELEEVRGRFDSLNQEKTGLMQAIDTQRARLETQVDQLKHRMDSELTPTANGEIGLVAAQADTRRKLEGLAEEEQELLRQRQQQQTLATRIGEAQTTAGQYRMEGEELRKKLDLLNNPNGREAVCPLCGTPLSEDGCQGLGAGYQLEIEAKRGLYRDNQSLLKTLESQRSSLEEELPKREQAYAQSQRELQVKLSDLERRLLESRQAQRELGEAELRLAAGLASLEAGDFAATEHSQLEELGRQIGDLGYDDSVRQQSYAETRELQVFEERRNQLLEAQSRLPEEQESLAQTLNMLQRRRVELAGQEEQIRAGEEAIAGLPQLEERLDRAEGVLKEQEASQQTAIARRGDLEGQLRRLAELNQEIAASADRLFILEEEQGIYQELASAWGRQGVQAMLIETVVPRLEEEGNAILGRMTDNRMFLKLETQRERRTGRGEPIETLEINVSDELGPRSYEMYSGGEAFRVNLALRVALSKVLSQRMGAPLPTLFIDEGFGTQDTAGRERILDVISAIQDDFEKIIVITHLEDLKDMFPVRIEVQKDGDGSTFWLS